MSSGGGIPPPGATSDKPWPLDERVRDFITQSYLRGWGLTGSNVDLERGTAMFPGRDAVEDWNDHCVKQMEHAFGETMEGVDIQAED